MKRLNKTYPAVFLCLLLSVSVHSQLNIQLVEGTRKLAEEITNFFTAISKIDDAQNKKKAQQMAVALHASLTKLITTKDSMSIVLQFQPDPRKDYYRYTEILENRLNDFRREIQKYDALITTSGINAQRLQEALYQDLNQKMGYLLRSEMGSKDSPQYRKQLIDSLKTCVDILRKTQETLKNFKPA